jgi:hypothetical protein
MKVLNQEKSFLDADDIKEIEELKFKRKVSQNKNTPGAKINFQSFA